jgi:hypothetical protein
MSLIRVGICLGNLVYKVYIGGECKVNEYLSKLVSKKGKQYKDLKFYSLVTANSLQLIANSYPRNFSHPHQRLHCLHRFLLQN